MCSNSSMKVTVKNELETNRKISAEIIEMRKELMSARGARAIALCEMIRIKREILNSNRARF
jgi:hypothetical protein